MSDAPKTKCPEDTPFKQQRLPSWQPILTPEIVIFLFILVGVIFIPIGVSLRSISDAIYEDRITYDGDGAISSCGITTANVGTQCTVSFTLNEDISETIHVYYELKNFYQNHRRYVSSKDPNQLMGTQLSESDLKLNCDPLVKNGSQILNPCGLIANSFFNDKIVLTNNGITLDETDISWESDRDMKFKQVEGFVSRIVPLSSTCSNGETYYIDKTNTSYCYSYPDDDKYQYLYETYPGIISPIDGVTDEHFIVWMRTAGLPNFRKLYGRIEADMKKGDVLNFDVTQNFDVSSFDGSKSIVISTVGEFGGKNPFLGIAYIVVGAISLFFGCLFLAKHVISPRKMGDISKLHWN